VMVVLKAPISFVVFRIGVRITFLCAVSQSSFSTRGYGSINTGDGSVRLPARADARGWAADNNKAAHTHWPNAFYRSLRKPALIPFVLKYALPVDASQHNMAYSAFAGPSGLSRHIHHLGKV